MSRFLFKQAVNKSDKLNFYLSFFILLLINAGFILFIENGASFVYTTDTAYLNLANVKDIWDHQVSISNTELKSSTSILWMLILAIFSWMNESSLLFIPLILNFLFMSITIYVLYLMYENFIANKYVFNFFLFSLIILLSVNSASIILMGAEYSLETMLVALTFLTYLKLLNNSDKKIDKKNYINLLVLGILLTMAGYELAFLAIVISFHFSFVKDFEKGMLLLFSSLIPFLLVSTIMANYCNLYFFPDIILNSTSYFSEIRAGAFKSLSSDSISIALLFANILFLAIAYAIQKYLNHKLRIKQLTSSLPTIILPTFVFSILVSVPTPIKQDAFLSIIAVMPTIEIMLFVRNQHNIRFKIVGYTLFSLHIAVMIFIKVWLSFNESSYQVKNIYDSYIQNTYFLNTYYPKSTIGVDKMGVYSYFTKNKLVDISAFEAKDKHDSRSTYSKDIIKTMVRTEQIDWIIVDGNKDLYQSVPFECVFIGYTFFSKTDMSDKKTNFYYCKNDFIKAGENFKSFIYDIKFRTKGKSVGSLVL